MARRSPPPPDGALPPPDQRLPTYAIVSQEFFQRHFGGDPAVLGKPVAKDGPILVGVLERGFELLFRPDKNIERRPDYVARRAPRPTAQPRLASACA